MGIPKATSRLVLTFILTSYISVAAFYAVQTPRWQAPDEPAHFNYIEHLATQGRFPVLETGDYPHDYLEEIKGARFPPHMSIASIRYESHQPPLYYVLAAFVYRLTSRLGFDRQFLALRLFSVVLGAMVLYLIYRLVRAVFEATDDEPGRLAHGEFLALAAAAFAAIVPMHIAMTAAINNDTLAELLLLLILWQAVRDIRSGPTHRRAIVAGVLLGLALLTKTTLYVPALGIVVISALLQTRSREPDTSIARLTSSRYLLYALAVSLLLAGPWFARNAVVYGSLDVLGWRRHDMVVTGQLRTTELLSQIGPVGLAKQFVVTTFRSFWAQFGWMGVLVDGRLYQALALLSMVLALGFVSYALQLWRGEVRLSARQGRALLLLAVSFALSLLTYLGYNIKFVQHQGRYLFTALGPIAAGAALGLEEILRWRTARLLVVALLLFALLLVAQGVLVGDLRGWSVALLLVGAALLAALRWLPTGWQWLPLASAYLSLLILNPILVRSYIVPALTFTVAGR
ncbi:MAG: glycosyltransferase family 39 protein [Anaerolineales bacterium]|nr:MAG: glycosyltransferase family 39 protein [Anaerolineales bacterium]